MDAVQAANSGHPGSPMGMAPTAYVLWQRYLRFNPENPTWGNRDRFVLSAGHASTLLYALLHLTAVPPEPLEELEKLEQLRALAVERYIRVGVVGHAAVGVDTPADYERFVQVYRQGLSRSAA